MPAALCRRRRILHALSLKKFETVNQKHCFIYFVLSLMKIAIKKSVAKLYEYFIYIIK